MFTFQLYQNLNIAHPLFAISMLVFFYRGVQMPLTIKSKTLKAVREIQPNLNIYNHVI